MSKPDRLSAFFNSHLLLGENYLVGIIKGNDVISTVGCLPFSIVKRRVSSSG